MFMSQALAHLGMYVIVGETGAPGAPTPLPDRHGENMQTGHRKALPTHELNPGP